MTSTTTGICSHCRAHFTIVRGVLRVHGNGRGICRGSSELPVVDPWCVEEVAG